MSPICRIACLALVALALAGCGKFEPTSYDSQVQHNFVTACTNQGAPEDTCTKVYECITSKLSFADFKTADSALADHKSVDPKVEQVILACVNQSR